VIQARARLGDAGFARLHVVIVGAHMAREGSSSSSMARNTGTGAPTASPAALRRARRPQARRRSPAWPSPSPPTSIATSPSRSPAEMRWPSGRSRSLTLRECDAIRSEVAACCDDDQLHAGLESGRALGREAAHWLQIEAQRVARLGARGEDDV
jgi:hypothetical protein